MWCELSINSLLYNLPHARGIRATTENTSDWLLLLLLQNGPHFAGDGQDNFDVFGESFRAKKRASVGREDVLAPSLGGFVDGT